MIGLLDSMHPINPNQLGVGSEIICCCQGDGNADVLHEFFYKLIIENIQQW